MGNSLPCVERGARIARRIGTRAVWVAAMLVSTGVVAVSTDVRASTEEHARSAPIADTAGTTGRSPAALGVLTMPGARFRAKDRLVVDAVAALGYLMGTENTDDPVYVAMRRRVSDAVSARMDLDPAAMNRAWSRAPRDHQLAVLAALSQLGVRYVEGKEEPHVRMDCSGLLWYSWRVAGVDAPRVSVAQLDPRMRISSRDAIVGDIAGEGTHVHMYLGVPKAFVHAPYSGRRVKLKIMKDAQWNRVAWTNPSNIATYRL